ncbi:MAG: cytochrome b N-terminal domain-containing protein [Cyanobacteria bacterium]|nr:cytochrome b N-terminal domain-containing protein [Cyanobacteriota bacterium]MDA1021709.1 cytochrome b N-terminal domain-containing protein [Cyanobacteriota bacterium]
MFTKIVRAGQVVFLRIEDALNKIFSSEQNILYYHGAMPNFFMWILFLSGLLLFVYYMPTLEGAYQSVEYITHKIPFGDMIRGIHRYAADAMLITVLLHALRVYFTDRYRSYRIIAWYSGIALIFMMTLIGISGYILVWDERSYIIVTKISEFLAAFPIWGQAWSHAFINDNAISNYTMSMALFLHTGTSFSLLVMLWIHYMRISRPVVNVTWALGCLLGGTILIFAGLMPATSGPEAVLIATPTYFDMDWFYLWIFPVMDYLGNIWTWVALAVVTLIAILLPEFVKSRDDEPATVNKDACVGCKLCAVDCPYEAIYMAPRTDGSKFKEIAVVIDARCAECGLCVGACNFDAIELPAHISTDYMDQTRMILEASV